MHFHVGLFCVALGLFFFGFLAWRYAGSEADNYFREGEPDYIRWTSAGIFGRPPPKENRSEIRRNITFRGRIAGATFRISGSRKSEESPRKAHPQRFAGVA